MKLYIYIYKCKINQWVEYDMKDNIAHRFTVVHYIDTIYIHSDYCTL